MGIDVIAGTQGVEVRVDGIDRIWSLSNGVSLAPDEIIDAFVAPRATLLDDLGWRIGGTYFPGRMTLGHYSWRHRRGLRQLWFAYADDELLAVDTTRLRPARVVVQHPDRHGLADAINALRRPSVS